MRRHPYLRFSVSFFAAITVMSAPLGAAPAPMRGLLEVDHTQVEMRSGFWGARMQAHQKVTLPHALDCLEQDGHVTNFDKAAGKFDGALAGHSAFDSDLYKALEGALISLQHFDDSALRQRVGAIIERILAAQQPDGFLIAYYIVKDQDTRWDNLRRGHPMYNAGHFFEMAVAEQSLSGQPKVLAAAQRFADHIDGIFGANKRYAVDGHEEVELALIRLYRATGERRYLDLAKFFLDERGYVHGTEHKLFGSASVLALAVPVDKLESEQQPELEYTRLRADKRRIQDHQPVIDQHEAVGHAVRAAYLYSAMTDIVRLMEAPGYAQALDDLWRDVVNHKMYLTGSLGTGQYDDEGFGDAYLLPNESAYCETCAAIAHIFWQYRMALLKANTQYADLLELTLYNGMLAGISIAGDQFFYQNPLASVKGASRHPWIGLSCCPTNMARLIPQIGGFMYAQGLGQIYVNLYAAGEAKLKLEDGAALKLTQQTKYPWDGHVALTIAPESASSFELCLRIPGWARGRPVPSDLYHFTRCEVAPVTLKLNGQVVAASPGADGYLHLQRTWQAGDVIELDMPMPIQRVVAHAEVAADRGKLALMRGPLVYCLEAVDQPGADLAQLALPNMAELHSEHRADLLGGVTVLTGQAVTGDQRSLAITAVPYYAWANREPGAMRVWLKRAD
ncbi:MAG: glycoside hydrolase family 127 protein [Verrucomicrobia bacterium]|nr:MAG: glycoside hydrolase family 127 protein [Verrucomicrobiota bacterium]